MGAQFPPSGGTPEVGALFPPGSPGGATTPLPTQAILWSMDGTTTQSGWTGYHNGINPSQSWITLIPFGRYSTTANETLTWNLWLTAGTYDVTHWDFKSTHFGKGQIELNGVSQFQIDQSASSEGKIIPSSVGTFTVSSSGMQAFTYRCLNLAGALTVDTHFTGAMAFVLNGPGIGKVPFPSSNAITVNAGFAANGDGFPFWITPNADHSIITGGDGTSHQNPGVTKFLYDGTPGAAGHYFEQRVWLDAGTYNLDCQTLLGGAMGVGKLTIDGTPMGTPQSAGTIRPLAATSSPGNGNNTGSALVTGEIDHYDACTPLAVDDGSGHGGTFATFSAAARLNMQGVIANALTNIVISTSGWKTVRYTCSGKNSASADFGIAFQGFFRRTA